MAKFVLWLVSDIPNRGGFHDADILKGQKGNFLAFEHKNGIRAVINENESHLTRKVAEWPLPSPFHLLLFRPHFLIGIQLLLPVWPVLTRTTRIDSHFVTLTIVQTSTSLLCRTASLSPVYCHQIETEHSCALRCKWTDLWVCFFFFFALPYEQTF